MPLGLYICFRNFVSNKAKMFKIHLFCLYLLKRVKIPTKICKINNFEDCLQN